MEGFIELIIGMWIVAIISFAPLGYFIYIFSKGDGHSFGKSDPAAHKVEDGKYYDLVNNAMQTILGSSGKTDSSKSGTNSKSNSDSAAVESSTESTTQSAAAPVVGKGYGSTPLKR